MTNQILFSMKNKTNTISLSSAEFAHSIVSEDLNTSILMPIDASKIYWVNGKQFKAYYLEKIRKIFQNVIC